MIEISGGELATHEESQQHVQQRDIQHPVLWDDGNRNHKNYGITSWPAAYLIGRDGKVFWQGNPERMESRPEAVAEFRSLLQQHLAANAAADEAEGTSEAAGK